MALPTQATQQAGAPSQPGPSLSGSVDEFYPPDMLLGWVVRMPGATRNGEIRVSAYRNGRLLGSAVPNRPRRDIRPDGDEMIGFTIYSSEPLSHDDVAFGAIRVEATDGSGETVELRKWAQMVAGARRNFAYEQLRIDEPARLLDAVSALAENRGLSAIARDAVNRCIHALRIGGPAVEKRALRPNITAAERMTALPIRVGATSLDGSTVVGMDGYLYLTEGSNRILSRYGAEAEEARQMAAGWVALLRARGPAMRARGVRLIQMIVPEKITLLPENFPFAVEGPTEVFAGIEDAVQADPALQETYLSVLSTLRTAGPVEAMVPRLDTHLTAQANRRIIQSVLHRLGQTARLDGAFDVVDEASGDLAARFVGGDMLERVTFPSETWAAARMGVPTVQSRAVPADDRHTGITMVWTAANAPVKLRVVAFGNSYFERAGGPNGLSWWACRVFSEFHFVWSVAIDHAYLDEVKPDLVIWQTVERFLFTRPPET